MERVEDRISGNLKLSFAFIPLLSLQFDSIIFRASMNTPFWDINGTNDTMING